MTVQPHAVPRTICVDFDGVVHSHTTPFTLPTVIPDPPVPGAFDALVAYIESGLQLAIFSCRNKEPGAIPAMQAWFAEHGFPFLEHLWFPETKPGAIMYIDDRAHHFTGTFPSVEHVHGFRTWLGH